ncbi:uncharacterized protein LOC141664087 isoform X3 [Apium graveolens]|uniref:uncharacterized protein LOC141664087 isoform X3 n=1 Tax=Apium graveolens TaxID=4045 RepID=UPI003D7AA1C2
MNINIRCALCTRTSSTLSTLPLGENSSTLSSLTLTDKVFELDSNCGSRSGLFLLYFHGAVLVKKLSAKEPSALGLHSYYKQYYLCLAAAALTIKCILVMMARRTTTGGRVQVEGV